LLSARRFSKPSDENANTQKTKELTDIEKSGISSSITFCLQKYPELTALIERWDTLPESVRRQIIELAGASGQ